MTKQSEIFYERYSYLADKYASKLWDTGNIGMELDDIKQELRIKLFLSIKSYAKRWIEYKNTGRRKPIPIEFYLKTAMINQVRDFVKEINKIKYYDLDETYNIELVNHEILEVSKSDITIGFQQISDLFSDKYEKKIMKLYFAHNFDVKNIIRFSKQKTKKDKEIEIKTIVDKNLKIIREYLEF